MASLQRGGTGLCLRSGIIILNQYRGAARALIYLSVDFSLPKYRRSILRHSRGESLLDDTAPAYRAGLCSGLRFHPKLVECSVFGSSCAARHRFRETGLETCRDYQIADRLTG